MQRLDWSALIQPIQSPACTQEAACNHGKVVTGSLAATHQAIDYKEETSIFNHVTTENTETEEIRPHHAAEKAEHLPGGEWCANDRAESDTGGALICRPVLHYRLTDAHNGAGSVIGEPGEALADLVHALLQHYGTRLDLESVPEPQATPRTA